MQVRNTPLQINQAGDSVTVAVGAGGSGVYYGPYRDHDALMAQGILAAPGSTFSITTPTWVLSQGDRDGAPADVQIVTDVPQSSPSAGSGVPTVINARDSAYGAKGDGTTDDYPAILAAMTAAFAAGGGDVYLPPGTYTLLSGTHVLVPSGLAGRVRLRGAGRGATTIRLSNGCPTLLAMAAVAGQTWSNLTVEDLTIDANNVTSNGSAIVADLYGVQVNLSRLEFRRIDVINAGTPTAGLGRRCLSIGVQRNENYGATPNTITGLLVEDCNLGASGGGGNVGILIYAFASTAAGAALLPSANATATLPRANVQLDDITIRHVTWNGGAAPTQFQTSTGIQITGDGQGLKALIDNCLVDNSSDSGIEIDNTYDCTVRDTRVRDAWSECFYLSNNFGGSPNPNRMLTRFVDCVAVRTQATLSGVCQGFASEARNGAQLGHVVFERCRVESAVSLAGLSQNPGQPFYFAGPHRSVTLRDCKVLWRDIAWTATANGQAVNPFGLWVNLVGSECALTVDGLDFDIAGTIDNGTFTGAIWQVDVISINQATRLNLDIRGLRWRSDITQANGAQARVRAINVLSGNTNLTDGFAVDNLAGDYIIDAGAASDLAVTGGALTSAANHGVEKRARWVQTATSSIRNQIQRLADGSIYATVTPGATLTGFKAGALLKVSDDANTRIECYVTDNGAASTLVIDKVVAGTRTNLASQSITRLASGTAIGVRGRVQGNVITADYFANATVPAITTAGATTATATLAGSDTTVLGADGPTGWAGFVWAPQDAAATLDNLRHDRMHVVAGSISGLRGLARQAINQARGLLLGVSSTALRIVAPLRLHSSDLTGLRNATTFADVVVTDTTHLGSISAGPTTWATQPAPAAVTVSASPFTYTNQDGYVEDVAIYGGTVSSVTVTRSGGAAQQVASATGAIPRLAPGDALTVTYSVAPTMSKVPVP